MNNDFLQEKNFKFLINYVFNDIKQKGHNIDDKKYMNIFKKLVQTIYTKNLDKNVSKEYLNNLVIDKCIPFIEKQIEKDNTKNTIQHIPNLNTDPRPISSNNDYNNQNNNQNKNDFSNLQLGNSNFESKSTSIESISSRSKPKFDNNDYNNFSKERNYSTDNDNDNIEKIKLQESFDKNVGIDSNTIDENVDIMARMQQLENERNYSNQTNDSDKFNNNMKNSIRDNDSKLNNIKSNDTKIENNFLNKLNKTHENNDNHNINNILHNLSSNHINNNNSNNNNDNDNSMNLLQETYAKNNFENLELSVKDSNNKVENSIENIDNLKKNQDINEFKTDYNKYVDNTFLNTNYTFTTKKKVLVIDISNNLPDIIDNGVSRKVINNISNNYWHNFRVELQEELHIDRSLDVYLESITVNNPAQSTNFSNSYFVIDIAEFNIKTNTNNPFMSDKFIIPNENIESSANSKIMKYHLKSNYIANVNPMKLDKLTFTITNENNESVGVELNTTETSTINNAVGYNVGSSTITVASGTNFKINDSIYNSNHQLIGVITNKATNDLYIKNGISVPLYHADELYLPSTNVRTALKFGSNVTLNETSAIGISDNTGSTFSVGDNVYIGNGALIGKITDLTDDDANTTITIGDGTSQFIRSGIHLYKSNPLPKVFNSNNKSNRMILELMFISK
jgi:hypothetical protein